MAKYGTAAQKKVAKVMREYKQGATLRQKREKGDEEISGRGYRALRGAGEGSESASFKKSPQLRLKPPLHMLSS